MEVENILKLIQAVSDSELTDFHYKEGDISLNLVKGEREAIVKEVSPVGTMQQAVPVAASEMAAAAPVSVSQAAEATAEQPEYTGEEVKSPLVGTFYSAPSPEDEPFVKVGDTVTKGQTLGIVEAMKLMNEIESEYDGVVKAILVQNEEVVEYGQPLFVIG